MSETRRKAWASNACIFTLMPVIDCAKEAANQPSPRSKQSKPCCFFAGCGAIVIGCSIFGPLALVAGAGGYLAGAVADACCPPKDQAMHSQTAKLKKR